MAEIESRLPLMVRGFSVDPANAIASAQNVRGKMLANEAAAIDNATLGRRNELALSRAEMSNELAGLELGEARSKLGAMNEFRAARAAGDENATEKLAAYPEMQLQMEETLNSLEEQDRIDVVQRGRRVADAARTVMNLPAGSQQQKDAWNAAVQELADNGDLDPAMAESFMDNPSPLVLNQALRMGETIEQYIARQDAEKQAALAKSEKRPTNEEDLTLSQVLEIDKQANDRVKAAQGNSITPLDPAEARTLYQEARNDILRSLGIKPKSAKPKKKGKGGGETSALPTEPPVNEPAMAGGSAEVDWTTLSPEAQKAALAKLEEGIANPATRQSTIDYFTATFGEEAAAAALQGR